MQPANRLFTYGMLQLESVQRKTFGRLLDAMPDVLPGYRLTTVTIDDQDFIVSSGTAHHKALERTGDDSDRVEGLVVTLTDAELAQADDFEPHGYARQRVTLGSGSLAWVYLYR